MREEVVGHFDIIYQPLSFAWLNDRAHLSNLEMKRKVLSAGYALRR